MHLSKLQGKRSLGLSALLAQRNSDTRPAGSFQGTSDEANVESKFLLGEEQRDSIDRPHPHVTSSSFELHQQSFNAPAVPLSQTVQEKLQSSPVQASTGIASWQLCGGPSTGTATWAPGTMMEVVPFQSEHEHTQGVKSSTHINGRVLLSKADVNIFHQNSRDISASFIEKQRRMIVDLNEATSSIKLQLQCMQQERDEVFLENSALQAAIEEQKHEQQTQLLSFSLKLLQDEAEMRKYHDEIHGMRSEITMYRRCFKDINDVATMEMSDSHEKSSIWHKISSIHNKYFPLAATDLSVDENRFPSNPEISSSIEAIILSLDHDLAPHSAILKPIFEDMDKKYIELQMKKELEIANLTAQIHRLEALNLSLQKQNSHILIKSLTVDEITRKNAKKCDEHEAVIQKLQEEITIAHQDLKDRDVVLLHCLRDINVVRSEYATLEMERKLQYQASERDLAQKMHLSSEQVAENGEKLQHFRDVLAQKDSCLDDLRSRCDFLTSENGIMMKKLFALESLSSDAQSALARCKGELDIALLEKQMLTKIDEQRRLSQLQSSDSYHSQLELDYRASQETIDELRNKCDTYQASWFQFEKKTREEKRAWQQTKEQELRLMMEVSVNERVGTIEAEIKNLRQKLEDCKCAQMVEMSTIRNQAARASNQAAAAHAQKIHELESQNEACMQRIIQLQQLCQVLQKGNFSQRLNIKSL